MACTLRNHLEEDLWLPSNSPATVGDDSITHHTWLVSNRESRCRNKSIDNGSRTAPPWEISFRFERIWHDIGHGCCLWLAETLMLTYSQAPRYGLPPSPPYVSFPFLSLHANFVAQDRERSKGRDHRVHSIARNPVGGLGDPIQFGGNERQAGTRRGQENVWVKRRDRRKKERTAVLKKGEREREHTKRMRESPDCTVNVGHFESRASRSPVRKVSFRPRVL